MRLRTVLIAAGVVIGLPVIGLGVFVATFDANAYKPRIAAAAKEATGRELSLNGPIGLKLGLSPALRVEDVAFANAPWGTRAEMAKLQALEVEVAVLPLLSGQVQINRVVLVRPDILLETDAEGRGNWEIAAPAPQPSPPQAQGQAQAPAPAAAPQAGGAGREIGIRAVTITDGTVAFRDGRTRETITLALPRFAARADSRESPLSLDLEAALNGNPFTLAGTLGPLSRLLGAESTAPWPVDLTASAAGARVAIKGSVAEPKTGKGYDLAVQATVPDLSRLAAFLPNVELPPARNIELSVQAADRGRRLPEIRALTVKAGESDLNAFMPGLRLARLEVSAPDTRSPVQLSLAASLNGAPVGAEGTLGPLGAFLPGASGQPWPLDLRLTAAGAQATAKGSIARPATPAGIDIAIAATVPDLAALSPLAGGADLPAIKDVTFSARAQDRRNGSGGILRDIALKLGPSDLSGNAELEIGARPKLTATLASRRFDLDQLMAATGGQPAASQPAVRPAPAPPAVQRAAAPARLIPDTPLPFAALRAADAALKLAVGELVFGGATYSEAEATIGLDRGRLSIEPFKATAPGAPVTGSLKVDASRDAAPVAITFRAPAIDLRELLAAYGGGYRVNGTLELDIDVRGVGASPAAIAGTLDGHVGLAGVNLDIDNRLLDLVAGEVWRALVPGAPREGSNNVRCLAFRFDSTAGTAEARAFLFDSALAKVAGTGSVLLGPEQLRLRAVPTLKLGSAGIGVPVLIGGTFLAPAVRVDPAGAAGALVGALGRGQETGGGSSPLGAIAGALGGRQGGAQAGGAQAADDCPAQLAIARGGRAGAAAAPEAAPAAASPAQQPAPQPAPQQAPAPQQQQPANPLQQLLPRLGR